MAAIKIGSDIWVCMGDLNDVTCQEEKAWGNKVSSKSNYFLRNFFSDMGAFDMGFSGNMFTWCNRRWGKANIRECIDRVLASLEWRVIFNQAGFLHLSPPGSDHLPIQLSLI